VQAAWHRGSGLITRLPLNPTCTCHRHITASGFVLLQGTGTGAGPAHSKVGKASPVQQQHTASCSGHGAGGPPVQQQHAASCLGHGASCKVEALELPKSVKCISFNAHSKLVVAPMNSNIEERCECAGGKVEGLELPKRVFPCASPAEVRSMLPEGKDVLAFQCRNPIHKAHYELFIRALEAPNVGSGAVSLVHPTCGPTQVLPKSYVSTNNLTHFLPPPPSHNLYAFATPLPHPCTPPSTPLVDPVQVVPSCTALGHRRVLGQNAVVSI